MNFLQDTGVPLTINEETVGKLPKFTQTMCYSGMEDEWITETGVRIKKQLKMKTSQSMPANENSMLQAIKRIHYQLYYCYDQILLWFQKFVREICQRMVGWSLNEMFR